MIPAQPSQQKPPVVVIIMAKTPTAGRCNTRLAPRLGMRGAARLQQSLIAHRVEHALRTGLPVEIHTWPQLKHPVFLQARRLGVKLRRQIAADLGQRMRHAQGRRPVIIIGTDCPMLGTQKIKTAAKIVASGDAVCMPARDGGYVLLGLPRHTPGVFQRIPWGSSRVLAQTQRQLRKEILDCHFTLPLDDLDTPQDYRSHRQQGFICAPYRA